MRFFLIVFVIFTSSLNASSQNKKKIVTSASMIADMTKEIVGDLHDVEMIVPIGGDPHLHEPTPSNARLVSKADLIFINGLTFEGWITELIENSGTKATVVTVTEKIRPLTSQTYENSYDPHAWMDASLVIGYVESIAEAVSEIDPSNASVYEERLASYKEQLTKLDQEIKAAINSIPEKKRVLITSHDAFQYYGRRYGIQLEAIMGISTEAEAQTSDIRRVNKVIEENKVPAIFVESTINPKLIQQLAQDNKVSIGGELFADSLGDEESPASTYIDMMRYNTQTIVTALTAAPGQLTPEQGEGINWALIAGLIGILIIGIGITAYLMNR